MDLTRRALCLGLTGIGAAALPALRAAASTHFESEPAADESYWAEIARAFDLDHTLINLNNAAVSASPRIVLDAMIRDLRFCNEAPVHHLWDLLEPRIESVRRELAREFGCEPEEITITRGATEALETLIFGIDLAAGDEVLLTDQNHPRMIASWEQRARRQGIVVRKIGIPVPLASASQLLERFRAAITPRTRVIEISHVVHLTGQILPIRELIELGRARGIEVFVDGAHAFGHFPFKRDDLQCDYYGTSLNKWLLGPVGTGFLYVRKSSIRKIWPLFGAAARLDDDIRKFEEIGTHPVAIHNAVAEALAFHRGIGAERKAARLRYLRERWANELLQADARVRILTPLDDKSACAIATLHIAGIDSQRLQTHLFERHRILTSLVNRSDFSGLRITPHVYTAAWEIDLFCEKIKEVLHRGL